MTPSDTILFHGWYINTTYATLTQDERYHNGMRLAQLLYNYGWTEECIAGMLGNIDPESGLSPATAEGNHYPNDFPTNADVLADTSWFGGLGFVQWTPGRTELVQWAEDEGLVWYDGATQAKRFKYEYDNNLEWPYWHFYAHTTDPVEDCAEFFCRRYCRPADPDGTMAARKYKALEWYGYIHDHLQKPINRIIYSRRNRQRKELKRRCLRM